jgi:predicted Ser/Thr protein kinase
MIGKGNPQEVVLLLTPENLKVLIRLARQNHTSVNAVVNVFVAERLAQEAACHKVIAYDEAVAAYETGRKETTDEA